MKKFTFFVANNSRGDKESVIIESLVISRNDPTPIDNVKQAEILYNFISQNVPAATCNLLIDKLKQDGTL